MKKLSKVLMAVALLGLASCAKDYTCECEIKHEQSGPGFSETNEWDESTTMTGKEDEMKAACEGLSFEESYKDAADFDQKIEQSCTLR